MPRIWIYRGSFLFPVSFKEILRKYVEVAAADLALQEAFPLKYTSLNEQYSKWGFSEIPGHYTLGESKQDAYWVTQLRLSMIGTVC
jgi:hypothetical protein